MQKYSIWMEDFRNGLSIVIYHDADVTREQPLITMSVGDSTGIIALSNGTLLEYDMINEKFGIVVTRNNNTHIYRDGDIYALITEDELEWALMTPDKSAYVWVKRD